MVAADAGGREAPAAQPVVEGVEVAAPELLQILGSQFLGDGGGHAAVLDERLGGPAPRLDVVEPPGQQAAEGLLGQRDVALRRFVHELGRRPLRRPPAPVNGGRRVSVPAGCRVTAEGHPDLPNARRAFT